MCFRILVNVLSARKASKETRRIALVQIGDDDTKLVSELEPVADWVKKNNCF